MSLHIKTDIEEQKTPGYWTTVFCVHIDRDKHEDKLTSEIEKVVTSLHNLSTRIRRIATIPTFDEAEVTARVTGPGEEDNYQTGTYNTLHYLKKARFLRNNVLWVSVETNKKQKGAKAAHAKFCEALTQDIEGAIKFPG